MKLIFVSFLSCISFFAYTQTKMPAFKWGNPGYYTVNASDSQKVYFYTTPDTSTRRKAFFNKPDWVFIQKLKNNFGYTYFSNSNGAISVGWLPMQYLHADTSVIDLKVGVNVKGDFKEKGQPVYAFSILTKQGKGVAVDGGIPDGFTIFFSDSTIKPLFVDCCEAYLINEGDLDDDGNDELSVFQDPENGCTHYMRTYSFKNGSWKIIVPLYLVPTACEPFDAAYLQKQVFKLKDGIYYYDYNNDGLLPVKKKVISK
jgi:hypothetical protein